MTDPASLTIALGEYDTGWHEPAVSLARATSIISQAAGRGARLVMLPEMCATGFTMESRRWAESPDGESARQLADAARRHGVYVLAGLATARREQCFNSALLFTPEGELASAYDKQRRFGFASEDRAYAAGEAPVVVEVDGVRASLFICYDLRFPELFRAVGPFVDVMLLIANWPTSRRMHWETLTRARAIENQSYFVAVNRLGDADGLSYAGGSIAYDPWGNKLEAQDCDGLRLVSVSEAEVARVRREFPFAPDRRAVPSPIGSFAPGWPLPPRVGKRVIPAMPGPS